MEISDEQVTTHKLYMYASYWQKEIRNGKMDVKNVAVFFKINLAICIK